MMQEPRKQQKDGQYKDITTVVVGKIKITLIVCDANDVLLSELWPNETEKFFEGKRPPFSCISWLSNIKQSVEDKIAQQYTEKDNKLEMTFLEFQKYFLKATIKFSTTTATIAQEHLRQNKNLEFKICSLIIVLSFFLRSDEQYGKKFILINQKGYIIVSYYDFKANKFKEKQYKDNIRQVFWYLSASQFKKMEQDPKYQKHVFQREFNKIIYETFLDVLDGIGIGKDGVDPQKCFMAAHLSGYRLSSLRIHIDQNFKADKIKQLIINLKFLHEENLIDKQGHFLLAIGFCQHFFRLCQIGSQSVELHDPLLPADHRKKVNYKKLAQIIDQKKSKGQFYDAKPEKINIVKQFNIHILRFVKNGEKEYSILQKLKENVISKYSFREISRKLIYEQWRENGYMAESIIFGGDK